MPNPRIELDAQLNNADFIKKAQEVQVKMDTIKDASHGLGISTTALNQVLKEQERTTQKSTMSWTDFRSMYQTVLDVVRVGQAVWDEVGQKYVDNAIEAGNMARSLGTTVEEASRLREVADDVGISVDTLRTSMKLAQKDGFQPNIEGLAALADEYNSLAPGVERTQFLLDRFGKSGEDMGKLLEKGSDSIREMSAAVEENLIFTEEAYRRSLRLKFAQDNLNDSWDAYTYSVAPPLVDAMTGVINHQMDLIRAQELATKDGKGYLPVGSAMLVQYIDLARAEREVADAKRLATQESALATGTFEDEAEATKRIAEETRIAEQAIKDMTKANQDYLREIGELTNALDAFQDKERDLQTTHAELLAKKQELIAQGYWPESEAVQDINKKLAENEQAQMDNALEFELATRRRILARAEEMLSIDGLTTEEQQGLLEQGLAWGVYTQQAVDDMIRIQQEADALVAKYNSIPTNVSTTITSYYNSVYGAGSYTQQPGYLGGSRAAGGPVMAGTPYLVGERGPEVMTPQTNGNITPNNDLSGIMDYRQMGRAMEKAFSRALSKAG